MNTGYEVLESLREGDTVIIAGTADAVKITVTTSDGYSGLRIISREAITISAWPVVGLAITALVNESRGEQ